MNNIRHAREAIEALQYRVSKWQLIATLLFAYAFVLTLSTLEGWQ